MIMASNGLLRYLRVGVSPETENVRTNDTFRISCSIRRTGQGRLLFYDNEDGLISEEFIEVCVIRNRKRNKLFIRLI